MAVRKLIQSQASGATNEYAGKSTSAGTADAGEFPILNAAGKLDITLMPNGVGADSVTGVAGEALVAGDFVYITSTGAVVKADATSLAKAAMGYVLTSVLNAGTATVYFNSINSSLSGLTIGGTYYLSATAGLSVLTATSITTGQFAQSLGIATSATSLSVNIGTSIQRA